MGIRDVLRVVVGWCNRVRSTEITTKAIPQEEQVHCGATTEELLKLRRHAWIRYRQSVAFGNVRMAIEWFKRVVMCDNELTRRGKVS